jgi:hypothetical protein
MRRAPNQGGYRVPSTPGVAQMRVAQPDEWARRGDASNFRKSCDAFAANTH